MVVVMTPVTMTVTVTVIVVVAVSDFVSIGSVFGFEAESSVLSGFR